jgi:flagellar hook protein FlgE
MTGALQIAKTGMLVGQAKMDTLAANMANANAIAGKNTDLFTTAIPNVGGGGHKGSGGVTGKLVQNIRQSGSATPVDNNLFCAAGEKGFFVVDGGFTRIGTWDFNETGLCVNHLGKELKVYHVNPEGERVDPTNPLNTISDKTSQKYLTSINKYDLRMDAKATSAINFSYQLPQEGTSAGTIETSDATVFDSFGAGHNLKLTFTKAAIGAGNNIAIPGSALGASSDVKGTTGMASAWFVTIQPVEAGVTNTVGAPYTIPGAGMLLEFDNSGKPLNFNNTILASSSSTVTVNSAPPAIGITWGSKAADSVIAFNLGEIGGNNGVVSRGSEGKIGNIQVDGHNDGTFSDLQWTPEGYGVVIYNNGIQEKRFQIPMAYFANENGLGYGTDGIYTQTAESGQAFYGTPKDGIIGALSPSAIEESTISEIDTQVNIITNQQYFGAQATVFRTAREMLEVINTLKS